MADRPGEFELIDRYFRPLADDPGAFALLDDAALIRPEPGEDIVVTTDIVAEGVHFFAEDPSESIARKALRVNLSDLAGKGAEPRSYLLSIALRQDWTESWIAGFCAGLKEDQRRFGVGLLGGDTSRAAGGTTIAITAIGSLPTGTMVHRSGARAGDLIFVSGTIGDGALGLLVRQGRITAEQAGEGAGYLRDRYLHPQPRVGLAASVRQYASASMDVSDGLVGDLAHICHAGGVGAEIDASAVPLSSAARHLTKSDPQLLLAALTGGDDYEILVTIPSEKADTFRRSAEEAGIPVTRIGRVTKGPAEPVLLDSGGRTIAMDRRSFQHFGG